MMKMCAVSQMRRNVAVVVVVFAAIINMCLCCQLQAVISDVRFT